MKRIEHESDAQILDGLGSSRALLSVMGAGSILILYSIYRFDSGLGLASETEWMYPLPAIIVTLFFTGALALAVFQRSLQKTTWRRLDYGATVCCLVCILVLYCNPFGVSGVVIDFCRILMKIAIAYYLVAWAHVAFMGSIRTMALTLCGAFIVRSFFNAFSGIAGLETSAASIVFLPLFALLYLTSLRERNSETKKEGETLPYTWTDKATLRKTLLIFCLTIGCCGYLIVSARTVWFPYQANQGFLIVQFFFALANFVTGVALLVLFRRHWDPKSFSVFWVIPIAAIICILMYVLSNIDGYITLVGSFGTELAGAIVFTAIFLIPFYFAPKQRLSAFLALSIARSLAQSLSTMAFSLSASVEITTALSIAVQVLLFVSIAVYIPLMQRVTTHEATAALNQVEIEPIEPGNITSLRSELDEMRDELAAIKNNEPSFDRDALYREAGRTYGLTRREEEVLLLLAQGYTAKSIADRLVISVSTAKTHIGNVYSKFGVSSHQELLKTLNGTPEEN